MAANGKKYTDATKRYDREHLHTPAEALGIAKSPRLDRLPNPEPCAVRLVPWAGGGDSFPRPPSAERQTS
jgi:hypothetical protein